MQKNEKYHKYNSKQCSFGKLRKIFFKKRSVNFSSHYLKALKGEVERSKDKITATLDTTTESCKVQWSKTSVGGTLCKRK